MNSEIIKDKTNGKLEEIIEFAKQYDNGKSLEQCFETLQNISINSREHYGDIVEIYPDWAPMSLAFVFPKSKSKYPFNGGIIFHGIIDNKKVENFSVTLEPADGWRVHT